MIRLVQSCGPFLWPMLAICVAIAVLTLLNAARLLSWRRPHVQRVDASLNAILFWGGVSAVIGYLGQWNGFYKGLVNMARHGLRSPNALWMGIAESLQTLIFGLGILLVAGVIWFALLSYRRFLLSSSQAVCVEDTSATQEPISDAAGSEPRPLWVRGLLVLGVLLCCVLMLLAFVSQELLIRSNRFVWPVLAIAVVVLGIALVKTYVLGFSVTVAPHRQRWGLGLLVYLAVISFGWGLYGLLIELYRAAELSAVDVEKMGAYFARCLIGSSATIILSTWVAIITCIMWFMLRSLIRRAERVQTQLAAMEQGRMS